MCEFCFSLRNEPLFVLTTCLKDVIVGGFISSPWAWLGTVPTVLDIRKWRPLSHCCDNFLKMELSISSHSRSVRVAHTKSYHLLLFLIKLQDIQKGSSHFTYLCNGGDSVLRAPQSNCQVLNGWVCTELRSYMQIGMINWGRQFGCQDIWIKAERFVLISKLHGPTVEK